MALQKTITTPEDFTADYWRIVDVHISFLTNTVECKLVPWKDQAARTGGANPYVNLMKAVAFPIDFAAAKSATNVLAYFYSEVPNNIAHDQQSGDTPFFSDAVDV